MTKTRYRVDMVVDRPEILGDQLAQICEEGRKVVSIIWQPSRIVTLEHGGATQVDSGYVVVSERDFT